MKNDQKPNPTVVDQQHAINAYLDSLLAEVTEPAVALKTDTQESVVVALHPPVPEIEVVVEDETEQAVETEVELVVEAEAEAAISERPEWAQGQFQCLVFSVYGLKLAVPLDGLNGILTWPEDITEMPGHAPHFLGLLKTHEVTVKVVDPALLVMPEGRVPPVIGEEGRDIPANIIMIDQKRWGLAADTVSETITLNPDEVHWRTARGKRRWLAGTVIDHMCALLDVKEFARILESADSVD